MKTRDRNGYVSFFYFVIFRVRIDILMGGSSGIIYARVGGYKWGCVSGGFSNSLGCGDNRIQSLLKNMLM